MRVIYVSGSGRSGSTLLERVLHTTADAAAVGEFHCLWRLPLDALVCSCGGHAASDAFWGKVLAQAGIAASDLATLRRLESVVARSSFIRRHRYSLASLRGSPEVQHFLALQAQIFDAIANVSARSLIIDSSKAGPRAWIMACDPRVSLVHLYRRPADVIGSWRARKFDQGLGSEMQRLSLSRAAGDWLKAEHFARRLARQRRVVMIDYRALCHDPRPVIDRVLAAIDLPPTDPAGWLGPNQVHPASDYHSLNGNPDRFDRKPLTIRLRETDWDRYPPGEAAAIRCLGGLLSLAYPAPVTGRP